MIKIGLFRYKLIQHNYGYKLYVFKGDYIFVNKKLEDRLLTVNRERLKLGQRLITLEEFKLLCKSKNQKERDRLNELTNRVKTKVFDYVMNNDFNAFITITFDKKKVDREDIKLTMTKLLKFFNNYKYYNDKDFIYLVIPEWHKNKKAIHFHGFVKIDFDNLEYKGMDVKGNVPFYIWPQLFKSFGANRLTTLYNKLEFAVYYSTKYVIKSKYKPLHKYYYQSNGLKESEVICESYYTSDFKEILDSQITFNYKSDNITIYDFNRDAPIVDTIISVLELQKGD